MIPNPRRINPRVSPARHERATRRVLWLMGQAGYLGATGPASAPSRRPRPVAEDEEPADAPGEVPPAAGPSVGGRGAGAPTGGDPGRPAGPAETDTSGPRTHRRRSGCTMGG